MSQLNVETAKITFTSLYSVSKNGIKGKYYDIEFSGGESINLVFATSEAEAKQEAKQMLSNYMGLTSLENRIMQVAHRTNAFYKK